jgi:hypothetical protein
LENRLAGVRNCEKEKLLMKCESGNFFCRVLGSFLAEFSFAIASKNRPIADETVDYEGKLKCGGTVSEGEKA